MRRIVGLVLGMAAVLVASADAQASRRLILFIADGAGAGHWSLARLVVGELAVDQFAAMGLSDTRGHDHTVTESAAGATAIATGVRTFPGALGVGPDSLPRETIFEAARERGMSTGLITTTYVLDATPAAFYSHSPRRTDWGTIIPHLLERRPTVLIGGGRGLFEQAMTSDSVPLLDILRRGYTYVDTPKAFRALKMDTVNTLLALLAEDDLPTADAREPSLAELTSTALRILDRNRNGFFLMVENEETDTQAHAHRLFDSLAKEMWAFDAAIRTALNYQERHRETLIVVLADHETGGLTIGTDSLNQETLLYSTPGHTAEMVPVFAHGPGAERFRGLKRNDEIGQLLLAWVRRR